VLSTERRATDAEAINSAMAPRGSADRAPFQDELPAGRWPIASPGTTAPAPERLVFAMTTPDTVEALRGVARQHHIYYEVVPDLVFEAGRPLQVGLLLTLWATHERGARALPGCARCRAIFADLVHVATWAVGGEGGLDAAWERQPFDAALHSPSRDLAEDEVDLSLRLLQREQAGARGEVERDASLRRVRERLKALGVREGIWHPASGAPHQHA
jgi:hypothetical protein